MKSADIERSDGKVVETLWPRLFVVILGSKWFQRPRNQVPRQQLLFSPRNTILHSHTLVAFSSGHPRSS